MMTFEEKVNKLKGIIKQYAKEDVMIAFSGGVDSSLLLKMTQEEAENTGKKVYGIFLHTILHPSGETECAKQTAKEIGAEFRVIEIDELKDAGIENNPIDRCYRCKKHLFTRLTEEAKKLNVSVVFEGTNADDLLQYRPGIRAIHELGIDSPLATCGFTKAEVRRLAENYGISTSNKPSTPCLATRIPYDSPLSYERLKRIESGERLIRELGFYNVRVRDYENLVRIEVDADDLLKLLNYRQRLVAGLKQLGYEYITLDLEGFRSGSFDKKKI